MHKYSSFLFFTLICIWFHNLWMQLEPFEIYLYDAATQKLHRHMLLLFLRDCLILQKKQLRIIKCAIRYAQVYATLVFSKDNIHTDAYILLDFPIHKHHKTIIRMLGRKCYFFVAPFSSLDIVIIFIHSLQQLD